MDPRNQSNFRIGFVRTLGGCLAIMMLLTAMVSASCCCIFADRYFTLPLIEQELQPKQEKQ